jgi:hypothetical protein
VGGRIVVIVVVGKLVDTQRYTWTESYEGQIETTGFKRERGREGATRAVWIFVASNPRRLYFFVQKNNIAALYHADRNDHLPPPSPNITDGSAVTMWAKKTPE